MMKNTLMNILTSLFCYIQFTLQPPNGSLLDTISVWIVKLQVWIRPIEDEEEE